MCYKTKDITGKTLTWTNKIFYDDFSDYKWNNLFNIDSWNNSLFCCSDIEVKPTYNNVSNVAVDDKLLSMSVVPLNKEKILAYSSSISSYNEDILFGSFRITAKMSSLEGTSFGFFFFYSVTEEIDMEILGHESLDGKIRVSTQPIIRDSNGKASNLSQKVIQNNNSLYTDFIEYRFDWFKDKINFYTDGVYYNTIIVNIPKKHGKIVINHRTNGNPKWSRGPPVDVSKVYIKSMEFYFNVSSDDICKPINYGDEFSYKTDESWRRYTSSIIVASLFGFILLFSMIISVYRKSKKHNSSHVQGISISMRRP